MEGLCEVNGEETYNWAKERGGVLQHDRLYLPVKRLYINTLSRLWTKETGASGTAQTDR